MLFRDGCDLEVTAAAATVVGGRKVEKLTVLLFHIQSAEDTEEARAIGSDETGESGGSGLGWTEGTSSVAERATAAVAAEEGDCCDDDGEEAELILELKWSEEREEEENVVVVDVDADADADVDDDDGDVTEPLDNDCGSGALMSS